MSQIAHKSKTAAWFVSNCETPSEREVYVQRMQEYIDVDIYGKCGNMTCNKGDTHCNRILQRDYW
jgi:alpha-1,3-fucosyltransferase